MNALAKQLFQRQGFTLALVGAVILAYLLPDIGSTEGPLKTGLTTKLAVAVIFAIQGLSLPTHRIVESATDLRFHLYCQTCIFAVAPLLMLAILAILGNWIHDDLRIGFIYLSALPTTISSAIVMTSNSGGDSSSALFSTTLSNIIGVFATPLLCAFAIESFQSDSGAIAPLIQKLALLVLLPIIIGQSLRPFFVDRIAGAKKTFQRVCNTLIVFIVFAAYSDSSGKGLWSDLEFSSLSKVALISIAYLLSLSAIVWVAAPIATKSHATRIAAFFCGSQKTLAAGVPMASILFANQASESPIALGLAILPLMLFHPLQLFLGGALAPYLQKLSEKRVAV